MQTRGMACCGTQEITGLSLYTDPEKALKALLFPYPPANGNLTQRTANIPRCAHLIFTGTMGRSQEGKRTYGYKFATYLIEKGLGTVVESAIAVNPNSRHRLRVWVWTLDRNALTAWGEAVRAGQTSATPTT